jgi:hypothetical protein
MFTSETTELKAQWKAEVVLPEYSMQDIAAHNTKRDTWIVIHGQGKLLCHIIIESIANCAQSSISPNTCKIILAVLKSSLK